MKIENFIFLMNKEMSDNEDNFEVASELLFAVFPLLSKTEQIEVLILLASKWHGPNMSWSWSNEIKSIMAD